MALFAERALLPEGWARDVTVECDARGAIVAARAGTMPEPTATRVDGTLLPGMPNIHSHAFQRAMAGRAERPAPAGDDFWTWREAMYERVQRLDPDALRAIALDAYRAMARGGYTSVCEFHYVHRNPQGAWYAEKSVMAKALVEAAREAGLAICLLPALYEQAAPDGTPLGAEQRRFATTDDDVLEIARDVRAAYAGDPRVCVGVCAHSLRAVRPDAFRRLIDGSPRDVPVHLHIAEQQREVDAFAAVFGARPIAWLLANFDVDARWCLVHATRATTEELAGIARSGAIAGLCPTTEANLGDGIFGYVDFAAAGGAFGIGSDSNVTLSAWEELRLLEYGQRLHHRRRAIVAHGGRSCGETLYAEAARGGGRVSGFSSGIIAAGARADFVTIARAPDEAVCDDLDRQIFAL